MPPSRRKFRFTPSSLPRPGRRWHSWKAVRRKRRKRTPAITGQMTELKTAEAALEAERGTALTHIADLQNLRAAMEGDR